MGKEKNEVLKTDKDFEVKSKENEEAGVELITKAKEEELEFLGSLNFFCKNTHCK
jgi:hypothetical protein